MRSPKEINVKREKGSGLNSTALKKSPPKRLGKKSSRNMTETGVAEFQEEESD